MKPDPVTPEALCACDCGRGAQLHVSEHPRVGIEYGYACRVCDPGIGLYRTKTEAAEAWNARHRINHSRPGEDEVERVAMALHQAYRDCAERIMPRTWENLWPDELETYLCQARAAIAALSRTYEQGIEDVAAQIVQDVAELPDRTSPDDWPDAMLVTADELAEIVRLALKEQ